MPENSIGECRLCLQKKKLAKAHIIPTSFYSKDSTDKLYSDDLPYSQRRPSGIWDPHILCEQCDSLIGKLDDAAKRILIDKNGLYVRYVIDEIDPTRYVRSYSLKEPSYYTDICRFLISVLWRASISTKKEFKGLYLGPYEELAKKVILDSTVKYSHIFSFIILYLSDLEHPIQMYSTKRSKIEGINFYPLIMGYHKILIKVDSQKLLSKWHNMEVSERNNLLMLESEFKETSDYNAAIDMLKRKLK